MIDVTRYADLCEELSEVFLATGENELNTGELIALHLGSKNMSFHLLE